MKRVLAAVALSITASVAFAQMGGMKGMDMKGMNMKDTEKSASGTTHRATGVVTKVDSDKRRVTIKHGPVATLNWPGMSMAFGVKEKALLEKAKPGQKIEFAFVQEGSNYVITEVK